MWHKSKTDLARSFIGRNGGDKLSVLASEPHLKCLSKKDMPRSKDRPVAWVQTMLCAQTLIVSKGGGREGALREIGSSSSFFFLSVSNSLTNAEKLKSDWILPQLSWFYDGREMGAFSD